MGIVNPALLVICVIAVVFGIASLAAPEALIGRGRAMPMPGRTLSGPATRSQVLILRVCGVAMVVLAPMALLISE